MREWIIEAETIGNISDGYWYSNGEEIVRCKDCKHRQELRECPMYHLNYERYEWQLDDDCDDYTKADGFCDRGERKDDE